MNNTLNKISGIKSIDFTIRATGEGIVNHNGSAAVWNPAAEKTVKNHLFPKLRGLDPMRKSVVNHSGEEKVRGLSLADPELANAALIVSENCLRSHIFKSASFGVAEVTRDTVGDALASLHGLMRGYLVTSNGGNFARKSPLFMADLECSNPGLRYNQASKAGGRTETSIFSFFATDKDLQYVGHGSINIEDLQFIPLEDTHGRSAFSEVVSEAVGVELAGHVTQYLQDISGNPEAKAEFVREAVRKGTFSKVGEAGLLLNDAALDVVVQNTLELIESLYIRQSKGYVRVTDLQVDYNDGKVFRILDGDTSVCVGHKHTNYAQYYTVTPMDSVSFAEKMKAIETANKEKQKKSKKDKAAPKATVAADSASTEDIGADAQA